VIRLSVYVAGARFLAEARLQMKAYAKCVPGFSIVEVLVAVAVAGILATIAIPVVTGVPDSAKKEKLEQDVIVVNSAIDAYLAAGGDPRNLTAANVLTALKSRVYGGMPAEMMGPQGPFLDPTVATNPTDFSWSAVFVTDPRPRFQIERGTTGVVFGRGPAVEIGGVAQRVDEARPSWLWSYTQAATTEESSPIFSPLTAEGPRTLSQAAMTPLSAPGFMPPEGIFPLSAFGTSLLLQLTNLNPAGSSRVFFQTDQNPSWTLYEAPFAVAAPGRITARAVSLDPSRYSASPTNSQTYRGRPTVMWSNTNTALTYAQAASGSRQVSVTADGTGPFSIRYSTDGAAPTAGSQAVASGAPITLGPAMWSSATLTLTAAALVEAGGNRAEFYVDSASATTNVSALSTTLDSPTINPAGQIVFGSIPVTISAGSNNPTGTRIFYTYSTNSGAAPTPETGTLYSGPFVVSEFGVNQLKYVKARAYGPADIPGFWFGPSSTAEETYRGLNFDYYNLEGVLVGGGTIANNAALDGSVVLVSVGGLQPNVTFNNNSVLTGDVYAPGTPSVLGVPTNRIVNLDGAVNPTNYTINIQRADFVGKVYRRITPVTMPVVELPTGLTVYTNTVTSGTLAPGQYSNVDPGNGSTITIGVAGSTQPSTYVFNQFDTGNKFTLNVLGPVILTLNPGVANTITLGNNVVMGNVNHPEWLQVNMYTGNFTVGNGSAMYGSILNPNGTVSFQQNAAFVGGVTAKFINIENNAVGVSFSLPPPTVSPTPTPTPTPRPTATP